MPRGGRRPGSGNPNWKPGVPFAQQNKKMGRPPGSPNKKASAEILTKAFAEGIMPLELLIREMRRMYAAGDESSLREARMLAQAAAPYCHPRLQAIMAQTTLNAGDTLSELLKAIDGKTTGIGNGESEEQTLAIKQPLLLPN